MTHDVAEERQEQGASTLTRISNAAVKAMKEHYGKGPTSAKAYMVDDLLFIVMRGGLNASEKFLLEHGEADTVRQYRQVFENRVASILREAIEEITGRTVVTFNSQILFDPDMSIELFVFEDGGADEAVEATAVGQLEGDGTGEVEGEAPA